MREGSENCKFVSTCDEIREAGPEGYGVACSGCCCDCCMARDTVGACWLLREVLKRLCAVEKGGELGLVRVAGKCPELNLVTEEAVRGSLEW